MGILLWSALLLFIGYPEMKVKQRLNALLDEVYGYIEDEKYSMARAKSSSLVFSATRGFDPEGLTKKWEEIRENLLAAIDEAEYGEKVIIGMPNLEEKTEEPLGINEETLQQDDTQEEKQSESFLDSIATYITETEKEMEWYYEGYEKATFSKFNSPALENGLGETQIYIKGTLSKTELLKAADSYVILGFVFDEYNNQWLWKMHAIPFVEETHYDSVIGKELLLRGVYTGFSMKYEIPAVLLDELLVIENGETLYGMQKILDYSED